MDSYGQADLVAGRLEALTASSVGISGIESSTQLPELRRSGHGIA
jgi:hypothetical protein